MLKVPGFLILNLLAVFRGQKYSWKYWLIQYILIVVHCRRINIRKLFPRLFDFIIIFFFIRRDVLLLSVTDAVQDVEKFLIFLQYHFISIYAIWMLKYVQACWSKIFRQKLFKNQQKNCIYPETMDFQYKLMGFPIIW